MRLTAVAVVLAALTLTSLAAAAVPDAWQRAANRLDMTVLYPTFHPGLALSRVVPQKIDCGPTDEQLDGYYRGVNGNGKRLRVAEGEPFYCADIGDAPLLAHTRIHGKRASLYAYCEGVGCGRATYRFLLTWREQGIQVTLISRGSPRTTLYAMARSMIRVTDMS
jgi:hypothetical protein